MENRAEIRFYGRLRQLRSKRTTGTEYRFNGQPAVKDAVEALGVPHTEIDLLLVAGESVDFAYQLQNGDQVDVHPFGTGLGGEELIHLCPPSPDPVAFVLDVHLGKLARRLRMLGFDCRYSNSFSDPQIVELALAEGLIILTRDRGILKHSCVSQGCLITSEQIEQQVQEVLQRYRLYGQIQAFCRCPMCNGLLEPVEKAAIRDRLQPKTARYYQFFHRCTVCEQLYWQGSHYAKILGWVERLKTAVEQ